MITSRNNSSNDNDNGNGNDNTNNITPNIIAIIINSYQ